MENLTVREDDDIVQGLLKKVDRQLQGKNGYCRITGHDEKNGLTIATFPRNDLHKNIRHFSCFRKERSESVYIGHREEKTNGKVTFESYLGIDVICRDLFDNFLNEKSDMKYVFNFTDHWSPIVGVDKKTLMALTKKAVKNRHGGPPAEVQAVIGLATDGKYDIPTKQREILSEILINVMRASSFQTVIRQTTTKIKGMSHLLVLLSSPEKSFVLSDNGRLTTPHYILAGIDKIEYAEYIHALKKHPRSPLLQYERFQDKER